MPRPDSPEPRTTWIDALLTFALAYAYLQLLPECFSLFDEGIVADTADRLCSGAILYRDVFSYWTPAGFWLTAAAFRIAGVSVHTLRLTLELFGAAAAVMVWRLARNFCGRALSVIAGVAVPLVCYPIWWMASSHWYSTFSALATALALDRTMRRAPSLGWVVSTGLLCGVTFTLLQPVGVFVTATIGAVLLWDRLWTGPVALALKTVVLLMAGAICAPLLMYGYFAAHHAFGVMTYDTFVWTLDHFRMAFRAPYASLTLGMPKDVSLQPTRWMLAIAPPVAYAVGIGLPAIRYIQGTASLQDRQLLCVAATGAGLLAGNYYFPDLVHLAFAAPPAFAVGTAVWQRCAGGRGWQPVGALLFAAFVLYAGGSAAYRERGRCAGRLLTARGTIAASPADVQDLRGVLEFVATHLRAGEPFFAYPYAPGYYFLTAHPNPTRYEYLFPYLPGANTAPQLNEVVAALDRQQVRYVVLSLLWGRAMLARYDTAVERYIRDHYHIAAQFSASVILERDTPERTGPKISRAP